MVYSLFLNTPIAVKQGTPIVLYLFYEALDTRCLVALTKKRQKSVLKMDDITV